MISIREGMLVMYNGGIERVFVYNTDFVVLVGKRGVYNREELSIPGNLDMFLHTYKGLRRVKKKEGGPLCPPY
jgi:hypothetical protein